MSLLNRRNIVTYGGALVTRATLCACGFSPVYAPGGTGDRLQGRIAVQAPETLNASRDEDAYYLVRNLETRLGRSTEADYDLTVSLTTREEGQALTADRQITRYSLIGQARYALLRRSDGLVVTSGRVESFSGYSASGSTIQTLSSENDAHERLMQILADQIVAKLLAADPDTV